MGFTLSLSPPLFYFHDYGSFETYPVVLYSIYAELLTLPPSDNIALKGEQAVVLV
jgi:hypothetical protein